MSRMAARGRYYPSIGSSGRSTSFSTIVGIVAKSLSSLTASGAGTTLTWNATVPTVSFIYNGGIQTHDLTQYISGFNASTSGIRVYTGTLPTGVTLSASGELTYNGTSPIASSSVSYEIYPLADSDWTTRSTAPGVIRSFGFNSSADLGGVYGANYGTTAGTGSVGLDTSVKASGASSLRFDLTTSGNSCTWFTNFSSDLSKLYGGNSEFYVQWKIRVAQSVYEDWGHKYILIGSGDDGTNIFSSCTDLELELQPWANNYGFPITPENQFPIMYNACPGSCGGVFPFYEPYGSGDFKLQNAIASPYCRYQDALHANCIKILPEKWMVFQVGVQLGPRITSGGHYWFSNSRIRAWMQQSPGATEHLVIDWKTGITAGSQVGLCAGNGATGNQKFGKVWLLPYTQNNVASPRAGSVWYDELIISEQKISAALA
jgi:hypothetical protein